MRTTSFTRKTALACFALLMPVTLMAQSLWLKRSHKGAAGIEVLRPNFKNDGGDSFIAINSGVAVFATLRLPVSGRVLFVGELPFSFGKVETNSELFNINESESQSTIGNPYLGLEIKDRTGQFTTEFGLRLPATPEEQWLSVLTGISADFDRLEAFSPKNLAIMLLGNYDSRDPSGFALRLRSGPSLLIKTDKGEYEDSAELFLGYSAQAGYDTERFSVIGGVSGRALLSEGGADFGARSVHQLGFNASLGLGKARPGLHFRLPLDEGLKETITSVLGVNLGVEF